MVSSSQVKATTKYIKEHTRRYVLQCHKKKDADIIEYLNGIEGVNAYIKSLIRKDIENNQK